MYNVKRPGGGYNMGFYNPGFGMLGQGIASMGNLGNDIGSAFAQANAQSGYNMAAQVPADVERMRQQGMNQRLQTLSPLLAQIFGGGNGGQGTPRNITTNYGAGVTFGDGQSNLLPNGMQAPGPGGAYVGTNPNGVRPTASRVYGR